MSADNGIYILKTPNFKTGYTEFRVAHCQAIENINYPDSEDKYLRMYFESSKIFTDQNNAFIEAQEIYNEIMKSDFPIIEYGIQFITLDKEFPKS